LNYDFIRILTLLQFLVITIKYNSNYAKLYSRLVMS